MTLTVARLHALGVAILLRVPGNGSHVGHVVTLGVGVGRVRRVARHVRGGRVVLCRGDGGEGGDRWRENREGEVDGNTDTNSQW